MRPKEFQKHSLGKFAQCYAALGMEIQGHPCLFYAGEGQGAIRMFSGTSFEIVSQITEGGGGTMSMVPVPDRDGWLMVSRGFYSMTDSRESVIEILRLHEGQYSIEEIARLPFLHRFGVVGGADGTRYLVAASIACDKKNKDDWSYPGHLYQAALPHNLDEPFYLTLNRLPGDYMKNHGFYTGPENNTIYTGTQEGVFAVVPPERIGMPFKIHKILDVPAGDVAIADIDGDGENEIAVLTPFHGNHCKVFKNRNGTWREIYNHPGENAFYHAVTGAVLNEEQVFAVGARQGPAQLFLIRWCEEKGACCAQIIDNCVGPSNVAVLHTSKSDVLLSANRTASEAAIYQFYHITNGIS